MILAALLLIAAEAAEPGEAAPDCTSEALPQQDMNFCAAKDFEAADAELNQTWKDAAAEMKRRDAAERDLPDDGRPGYYQALLDAQRAWLDYRDKNCVTAGYIFRGGTMEPFMVASCKARLTQLRTEELHALVDVE